MDANAIMTTAVRKWMKPGIGIRKAQVCVVNGKQMTLKCFLTNLSDDKSPKTVWLHVDGMGGYAFRYGNCTMTGPVTELGM